MNKVRGKRPLGDNNIYNRVLHLGWEGGTVLEDSMVVSSEWQAGFLLWYGNRKLVELATTWQQALEQERRLDA